MAMDAENLASWIVLLFSIFRWLLHIFFATGYIILCKWLQHIRNHEFDQQHRKIDRRYCQMATVFYAIAAAAHLIALLKMMYRAMTGYSPDRQEKNWWEFLGLGIKMQVARLCLTAVVLTLCVLPDIILLFPYIRWLRRFEADDERRNVSYTIACIAVSAFNIATVALSFLGGLVYFMCCLMTTLHRIE